MGCHVELLEEKPMAFAPEYLSFCGPWGPYSPLAQHRPFPHVVGTLPQFVSLAVLAIPPLKLSLGAPLSAAWPAWLPLDGQS